MIEVILLKDVPNVGHKYEVKHVKPGYAQNFLIKQGFARVATKELKAKVEEERLKLEEERKIQNDLLEKQMESLSEVTLNLSGKANEQGHLFAKIHTEDLVKALAEQGHASFEEKHIVLSEPIKEVGEHTFKILAGDKSAEVTVNVSAE